ncbi:MAG: hypothetical protein H7Z71_05640 [Moraxellaceae bacterium]|nr:hypothetical protein [Pseudobdellovibrionaceae bacterium]
MARNFFYKYGEKNFAFKTLYEMDPIDKSLKMIQKGGKALKNCEVYWLCIFNGDFRFRDFNKITETHKNVKSRKKTELHHTQFKDCRNFFGAKNGDILWVFTETNIFAFELLEDKTYDADSDELIKPTDIPDCLGLLPDYPKLRKAKLAITPLKRFEYTVPEIFLSTDTSGIYGTIRLLDGDRDANSKIGTSLVTSKKIKPSSNFEILDFLSPTQLETFLFKVFDSNDFFVSSCKGASRSQIDLHIFPKEQTISLGGLTVDINDGLLLQVKRRITSEDAIEFLKNSDSNIFLFTLSDIGQLGPQNIGIASRLIDKSHIIKNLVDCNEVEKAMAWAKKILGSRCFDFN